MPQPTANWNLVEVRGRYVDLAGNPVVGFMNFTPEASRWQDLAVLKTIIGTSIRVALVNGEFSVLLPATDDPDITPSNFTYLVREDFDGGVSYNISVPIADIIPGLELINLAPAEPGSSVTSLTLARLELLDLLSDAEFLGDTATISAQSAAASATSAAMSAQLAGLIANIQNADDTITAIDFNPGSDFRIQNDARMIALIDSRIATAIDSAGYDGGAP